MKKQIKPISAFQISKVSLNASLKISGGRKAHETVEYHGDQACKDTYYEKTEFIRCGGAAEKCVIEC